MDVEYKRVVLLSLKTDDANRNYLGNVEAFLQVGATAKIIIAGKEYFAKEFSSTPVA